MTDSLRTNRRYLREEQYADDRNLRARIDLHRRFSVNPEPWNRWVFDRLALTPSERVLEVGCGPGELWRENLERLDPSVALTLTDFSAGMLSKAEEQMGARATYAVVDVEEIPYPSDSFDVVVANHMLYHVPDRRRALAEIARVLRPSGRFYAATIGEHHNKELRELVEPTLEWSQSFSRFGLENGAAQLSEHFCDVELELFHDHLEVTEVEPLLAYARSTVGSDDLAVGQQLQMLRGAVAETIAREGSFKITKATGLFSARGVPL